MLHAGDIGVVAKLKHTHTNDTLCTKDRPVALKKIDFPPADIAIAIKGDVTARDFCQDAVRRTVEDLGGLDVLVNDAAFQVHTEDFMDLTPEHFDETVKTNLYGYFHMTQAAVPHMKPGSAIVNSGSVTGMKGSAELVVLDSSHAARDGANP